MTTTTELSREVLEDRWQGLTGIGTTFTELGDQLSGALVDLADGLTRRDTCNDSALAEHMDVDGLIDAIGEWLMSRAAVRGMITR